MLEQTRQALATGRIILASGSPRRHEIIKQLGLLNTEIVPSSYDENLDKSTYTNYGKYVEDIAKYKVLEVYNRLKEDPKPPTLIIGADTMVTMDNIIYGKPKDKSQAFEMLSSLANREHVVYSGVCLKSQKKEINFYESTKVKFGDISAEQIETYINSGEPFDKAGAYGVQGLGGCLIEKIDGDFYTVMGMPLYSITKRLNELFSNS
ncbi:dTTP/UTP pyrophosphatase [Augochlora pura]